MNLPPYTIARYGVWAALAVAALSVWLGLGAGQPFDYAILRSVFFFLIVTVMAFAAEAVLLTTPPCLPHAQGDASEAPPQSPEPSE